MVKRAKSRDSSSSQKKQKPHPFFGTVPPPPPVFPEATRPSSPLGPVFGMVSLPPLSPSVFHNLCVNPHNLCVNPHNLWVGRRTGLSQLMKKEMSSRRVRNSVNTNSLGHRAGTGPQRILPIIGIGFIILYPRYRELRVILVRLTSITTLFLVDEKKI
jgi:hypothetical protein